jgi:hypothetical protein
MAVIPQEDVGQLASSGPTSHQSFLAANVNTDVCDNTARTAGLGGGPGGLGPAAGRAAGAAALSGRRNTASTTCV